jgi:hypothetical protein
MRVTASDGTWGGGRGTIMVDDLIIPMTAILAFTALTLAVFFAYMRMWRLHFGQFPYLVLVAAFFFLVILRLPDHGDMLFAYIKVTVKLYCQTLYLFTIVSCMRSVALSPYRVVSLALHPEKSCLSRKALCGRMSSTSMSSSPSTAARSCWTCWPASARFAAIAP